jgi:hypothetical protein
MHIIKLQENVLPVLQDTSSKMNNVYIQHWVSILDVSFIQIHTVQDVRKDFIYKTFSVRQ